MSGVEGCQSLVKSNVVVDVDPQVYTGKRFSGWLIQKILVHGMLQNNVCQVSAADVLIDGKSFDIFTIESHPCFPLGHSPATIFTIDKELIVEFFPVNIDIKEG